MDKVTIARLARRMTSKEDLLTLLNRMKQDEMYKAGMSDKYHPFTMGLLQYYCNPNHAFHRYKQFKIKKKSGGFRQISAPRNRSFILMLRYVNEIFKALYTPSDYAMGFTEGRSVVDNASRHKGMNYVFNTDIKDFFPSIVQPRVWKRLQLAPLNFPQPVANILAGLCSMRGEKNSDGTYSYILPQGAPTSPIITNMICDNLDRRLAGLARKMGLNYSRYADDITFSSMQNVYQKDGDFVKELRRIIEGQGFKINEEKTRLQKRGARQEVTGIIVSDKVNVSQKYVRDIRNILYIWDRYGYSVAFSKFFPKYKQEKGHVKKGNPDMVNVIDGKLMYLKMVKGEEDPVFVRLYKKFEKLSSSLTEPQNTTEQDVTYVDTMTVKDFEKKNNTEIVITMSEPKVKAEDADSGTDILNQPAMPHRYAYFKLGGRKIYVSVNKSIKSTEEKQKDKLSISYCRDARNKQFWLIHRTVKVTVPEPETVDIDELNDDLDLLLAEYGQ